MPWALLYVFITKNCSRTIITDQPWAHILKSNFKFNLLDRAQIDNIGSCYMIVMTDAIEKMANRYFSQCNYEVPFFHTQYIINYVDLYLFNGHPPRPSEATQINW